MTAQPDLQFRRLERNELEVAGELVESLRGLELERADCEAFGHEGGAARFLEEAAWGVFIRGDLVGAAWLAPGGGGPAEIVCVAMARGWWNMGLTGWVLEGLAKAARAAGAGAAVVRLKGGGPILGEILDDSGFSGPDPEADGYPAGVWTSGRPGIRSG